MNTIQIFQTENISARNGDYLLATRKGFEFSNVETHYDKLLQKLEKMQEANDGKETSTFKTVISFLGVFVAIILGFVEASNIRMTLVAIGNFSQTTSTIVAAGFVCMGLIIGEELNAGLIKDEFTGKKKPTGRFWGAVIMGTIYLGIQAFLALQASSEGAAEMHTEVTYAVIFSTLICLAEIAFGFIFLRTAITSLSHFALKIRIKLTLKKLNSIAKQVESLWNRYVFIMQKADVEPAEETEAVQRARLFYATGNLSHTNNSETN